MEILEEDPCIQGQRLSEKAQPCQTGTSLWAEACLPGVLFASPGNSSTLVGNPAGMFQSLLGARIFAVTTRP